MLSLSGLGHSAFGFRSVSHLKVCFTNIRVHVMQELTPATRLLNLFPFERSTGEDSFGEFKQPIFAGAVRGFGS